MAETARGEHVFIGAEELLFSGVLQKLYVRC